jgi:hypothetical protein
MNPKAKNIYRQKRTRDYTTIPNEMLNNAELSFKAKGIHAYLLSKPDNWCVYLNQLKKASKDGYDSVASGIDELIAARYVFRRPLSGGDPGGWEYLVFDEPPAEDPFRLGISPNRENSDSGKPATSNNRTIIENTNLIKKEKTTDSDEDGLDFCSTDLAADAEVGETFVSDSRPPHRDQTINSADHEKSPPSKSSQHKLVDDDFFVELSLLNPSIDMDAEVRKMKNWLLANPTYKFTRAFAVKWINKAKPAKYKTPRLPNGEIDWANVLPND